MPSVRPILFAMVSLLCQQVGAAPDAAAVRKAAVLQHAKIIYATYSDCTAAAKTLQTAVREFVR